jgi:hypothetical protein
MATPLALLLGLVTVLTAAPPALANVIIRNYSFPSVLDVPAVFGPRLPINGKPKKTQPKEDKP